MKKVVVKLTEKVVTVGKNKVVLTVNVSLEGSGKGESGLTGDDQPAVITISTREGPKAAPTLLATMTATAKQTDFTNPKTKQTQKVPKYDLNASDFKRELGESDTDNSVVLTFDSTTFKQPSTGDVTFVLRLPDVPPGLSITGTGSPKEIKVGSFELGAELSVAGNAEAPAFSDVAHVHLRHDEVQDDFKSTLKDLCIGATLVHPTDLRAGGVRFPPTPTRSLPLNAGHIEILLHPTVQAECDAATTKKTKKKSFDLSQLQTNLRTIFGGVFPGTTVENVPAGDARLKDWKADGKRLFSATVKNPPDVQDGEGHLVPFFQFWVHAPDIVIQGELANSEALADAKSLFVASPPQKRVVQPMEIPMADKAGFFIEYSGAKNDASRMILLANVIAHEVGHALGLLHVRRASESGYGDATSSALMAQQASGADEFSPALVLKKLHPVQEAVLRLHYR